LLQLGAAGAAAMAFPALAQARTIKLASTFDNSGSEKPSGEGCYKGATAYFNALNKAGGINGAKVQLQMADDQFKPDLARANALALAADKSILGLLAPVGTRQVAAVMEAVKDMAIVGPNSGTATLRKSNAANVFWVRASYDQEVDKLIRTAITLGSTRIGIVHPNDPLGKSVLAAFERSMAEVKLTPAVVATTPSTNSTEFEAAVQEAVKAAPQVLIMVMAGVAPQFVKALRAAGSTSTVYGLSISASASNIAALGSQSRGLGFAIVVPSPFAAKHEIVRRYHVDMMASGWNDWSLPSLEGYINARVMAEGLKRAGSGVTRESLIASLDRVESLDLGGITISYGRGNRIGSQFVDVAVVGADGRIVS
ncbi:MAG TPA: ABC transporter substrate-binding protein, partial [Rhizobacter sp.]|nr:ABC transporter substrate-binding protein [Rhizobacter sp.]